MSCPLFEFDGSGPALHIATANGFPPETYRPFAAALTRTYRVLSLPPRPLWQPPPAPEDFQWPMLADDLLAGLGAHGIERVVLAGHSMGGVASLWAALAAPQRVRALVLLDPTILPVTLLFSIRVMRALGQGDRLPLVGAALRRTRRFESAEAAYERWRRKALFADWPDETLRLYVEGITRPGPGGGVELAYPPEWEAQIYRTIPTDLWQSVRALGRSRVPVLVVRGAETDTFVEASARRFARLVPRAEIVTLPGHGHLFPQSAPQQAAEIVTAWLDEVEG